MESNNIILSEAKSLLVDMNSCISKTRDRVWQILGATTTLNILIIGFAMSCNNNNFLILLSSLSVLYSCYIFYTSYAALLLSRMSLNGFPPKLTTEIDESILIDCLISSYQKAISDNETVLNDLGKTYKRSLFSLTSLVIAIVAISFFYLY